MRLILSSLAAVLIVGLVVTPVSLAQNQPIDLSLEVDASMDGSPPLVHVRATNAGGGQATREFDIAAQNSAGARYPVYSGFFTLPAGGSGEQTFPWSPMDSGPQMLLIVDDETVTALVSGTTLADAPPPPPAPDTPLAVQTTACLQISGPALSLDSCPYSIGQSLPARPPTASLDTDRLQAPGRIATTAASCEIGRTDPLAAIDAHADTLTMASLGQQALPCCVNGTVKGTVSVTVTSNGKNYPLERVAVRLSGYCQEGGAPSPKAVTQLAFTDAQGHYQFTDVPLFRKPTPCDLATKLAYFPVGADSTGKAPAFAVKYDNENAPTIEGNQTAQCLGDTTTTVDLKWGQGGQIRPGCQNPCVGVVEDLAYLYFDVAQIFDYFTVQLGAKLVHALPIVGFSAISDAVGSTHFNASTGVLNMPTSNSVERARDQDDILGPNAPQDCPMNCEWHEFSHYVIRETIPTAGFLAGELNHAGYANKTTRDSWDEGWSIFWPAAFHARGVPADAPNATAARSTYQAATSFDLDRRANGDKWQATDGANGNAEDHAVASLLWDLLDKDSTPDSRPVWVQDTSGQAQQLQVQDQLSVDDQTLFSILAAGKPEDIRAVYRVLNQADLGTAITLHAVSNSVTYNDLDAVFLMHGFYHQRPIGGVSIVDPASNPSSDGQWGWTGAKADLGETANPEHPDRY